MNSGTASTRPIEFVRLVSTTWDELHAMVRDLNKKCRPVLDEFGRYLEFSVQENAVEGLWWKSRVRVRCFKRYDADEHAEAYRNFTLTEFLRLQRQILTLVEASKVENSRDSEKLAQQAKMTMSMFLDSATCEGECVICLERPPDSILPCTHSLCFPCFEQTRAAGYGFCPLCRYPLTKTDEAWEVANVPDDLSVSNYVVSTVGKRWPKGLPED
uniref:RING-type domain-containing protein n=1 Tax=Steinernema glaseri TaxID=37863 RepID=A0A1I8A4B8_9BILA